MHVQRQTRQIGLIGGLCLGIGLALASAAAANTTASAQAGALAPIMPAPPVMPKGLHGAEADAFRDALNEAMRGGWSAARRHIGKVQDTVAIKIIQWLRLREEGSGASLAEIVAFREQNPDWPAQSALAMRAEQALLDYAVGDADIIAWFTGQEPITGEGKLRLGSALIAGGRATEGETWIQRGWIEHTYSLSREKEILAQYRAYLPMRVHEDRLRHLLWEQQYSAARRMAALVSADSRKLAEARIKLMSRSAGVDNAVALVPTYLQNDPGLLFDRARFRRKLGDGEAALPLLLTAPNELHLVNRPDLWWEERHIAARQALENGLYLEAYALTQAHGLTEGADFADAEFLAGWIALQFLNKPDLAAGHFKTLDEGVRTPISKARAAYWRARAAAANGQANEAGRYYKAATAYPATFYGQLAIAALQAMGGDGKLRLPNDPQLSPTVQTALSQNDNVRAIRLLHDAGADTLVQTFALNLAKRLPTAEDIATLADIATEFGLPNLSVRITKEAAKRNILLTERSYPLSAVPKFTPKGPPVELALVYGLSRQESEFDPQAVSHAGARGLMQLMPATAKQIARQVGAPYSSTRLLSDPAYNAMLGTAHLGDLLNDFTGSYVMTIAAYNAGAHRVSQWVAKFGDPRSAAIDPIDWVETIPFGETRNYVQRVLENTQIYRNRLENKDLTVRLDNDLRRNTGSAMNAPAPPRGALIPLTPPRAAAPPAPAQIVLTAPSPAPSPTPVARPMPLATDPATPIESPIKRTPPPSAKVQPYPLPKLPERPKRQTEKTGQVSTQAETGEDGPRMQPIIDPADPHNAATPNALSDPETTASVTARPTPRPASRPTLTPLDAGDAVRPPHMATPPETVTR